MQSKSSLFGEMGKTVNSVNILGMWNCSQEKYLLFQAYSKLVLQFIAEISPAGHYVHLGGQLFILSVLCLGVIFFEVMYCPYKMGLFEPAVYV